MLPRLTYKLIEKYSFSRLIKMGFSERQIENKVRKYFLKESRQVIIQTREDLIKAKNLIGGTKIKPKVLLREIPKTQITQGKKDIRDLSKLADKLGKDSFASKILDNYNKGYTNIYQLSQARDTYLQKFEEYEENVTSNTKKFVQSLLIKDLND